MSVKTLLSDLINPQVMADSIAVKMVDKLKLTPFLVIDDTLVGQAGNTITVPAFSYIGDAEDIGEGVAMGTTKLQASTSTVTVKKAGKAVELTDESVLSGYGDPVGEAENQLATAMASKAEKDAWESAKGAQKVITTYKANQINYDDLSDAVIDAFGEDIDEAMYLTVNPKQYSHIRKSDEFIKVNGAEVITTGHVGRLAGVNILVSNRVDSTEPIFENILMKENALGLLLKREVEVESDRDILAKTTVISTDRHYTTYIKDESRVAVIQFDNPAVTE